MSNANRASQCHIKKHYKLDQHALSEYAADLAAIAQKGDVITLKGGLGVGKTTFARAFIRAFIGQSDLEVPSPTFTLVQPYLEGRHDIYHFDFYRLTSDEDIFELGFEETLEEGIVLIEWPENAHHYIPATALTLHFSIESDIKRNLSLTFQNESWLKRLEHTQYIRNFLNQSGWENANRHCILGDASTRRYERIHTHSEKISILMDASAMMNTSSISLSHYNHVARRATTMKPFLAVSAILRTAGFSAPRIYQADTKKELFLLEDLGNEGIAHNAQPIAERYAASIDMLAALHDAKPQTSYQFPEGEIYGGEIYKIPAYDTSVFYIEAELFIQWYIPFITGSHLAKIEEKQFEHLWMDLIRQLHACKTTLILRDFHAPNILWLGDNHTDNRQIGLIDFQDALWGPEVYDLVSLLQDARTTIPETMEQELLARYFEYRKIDNPYEQAKFRDYYAIAGAQRASKILGAFARLHKTANKSSYLSHIPRITEYLLKNLQAPILSQLRLWHEKITPSLFSSKSLADK